MNPTMILGMAGNVLGGVMEFLKKNWLLVLIVVVIITFYKQISGFVASIKMGADIKRYSDTTEIKTPEGGQISVNVPQVAYDIYDAFYNSAWGMFEDEDQAIEALKKVPKILVPQLAREYAKQGKKPNNLYSDFRKYLGDKKYKSIENLLN